ncbi:MAG: phosphohistidine phosphatase SixA [Spirochaetes bacterium]|nr:phosphohistidine phosphatase SixA [Spirochaetota bacterium]
MMLYLVQHASAKSKEEDPERPLSDQGIEEITGVASYVSRLDLSIDKIIHSTKLRAKQTALILAEKLHPEDGVSEEQGLAPMDDPSGWFEKIRQMDQDLLIVGHLPYLEKMIALLLCQDDKKKIISFQMGCMVALERKEEDWSVKWMVTPQNIFP